MLFLRTSLLTALVLGAAGAPAPVLAQAAKKPAARPAAQPAAKPAAKPATTPAAKTAARPAATPAPAPAPAPTPAPAPAAASSSSSKDFGLKGANDTFAKGTTAVNLGIGLVGFGSYYYSGASVTPLVNMSVEHGIIDDLGPGVISVGANLGYRRASYDYGSLFGKNYKWSWTDIYVGVRGAYHYNLTSNPKVDTYAGLGIGTRIWTYSDGGYYDSSGLSYKSSGVGVVSGLFAGARYYFTPNIGAFAEFGYDIALLKLGLSAKF